MQHQPRERQIDAIGALGDALLASALRFAARRIARQCTLRAPLRTNRILPNQMQPIRGLGEAGCGSFSRDGGECTLNQFFVYSALNQHLNENFGTKRRSPRDLVNVSENLTALLRMV